MLLLECTTVTNTDIFTTDKVSVWAKLVNDYGFMLIFSLVILLLGILFFIGYEKRSSKKSQSEIDILYKERYASIEQNNQMFNLVTNVQTEQVSQLQNIAKVLADINSDAIITAERMKATNDNIDRMSRTIMESNLQHESIISSLNEILDYVKTSSNCDHELLEKVNHIEAQLKYLEKN